MAQTNLEDRRTRLNDQLLFSRITDFKLSNHIILDWNFYHLNKILKSSRMCAQILPSWKIYFMSGLAERAVIT